MRRRAMQVKVVVCSFLLFCMACGEGIEDTWGSYEGTSEFYNATNFGMTTQTKEDVITITPRGGGESDVEEVWLGLDSDCVLSATVGDEGALTVADQACTFGGANSTDTWIYSGTGSASGDQLTLNLQGTFRRVYMAGPLMSPPLEGNHKLTFSGNRQ